MDSYKVAVTMTRQQWKSIVTTVSNNVIAPANVAHTLKSAGNSADFDAVTEIAGETLR